MKPILALVFAFTTACGSIETPEKHFDTELMTYVDEILSWGGDSSLDSSIYRVEFVPTLDGALGRCTHPWNWEWYPYSRKIKISKEFWDNATEDDRYMTLAHEILHCEYNVKHTKTGLMRPEYEWFPVESVKAQYQAFVARLR